MEKKLDNARRKAIRGQGMTEYIIIVAAVAILSIVVVTQFGNTIRMWFVAGGEHMAGQNTTPITNKMNANDIDKGMGDL